MGRKKLLYKEVKQYFEDRDCELYETEYINNKTLMKYRCSCGNKKCKIRFADFKKGSRCIECSGYKKYTLEEIKQYFEDHNCKLLETEYINNHTPMKYRCDCGNFKCKINFSNFKKGQRCIECGIEKTAKKLQLTFKEVKKYFEDHDCELLETEYKNDSTKMRYRCHCKRYSETTLNNFKKINGCQECSHSNCKGDRKRLTFELVYDYFLDHKCKLLETEYVGYKTPMRYECDCGNKKCKITFSNFKQGHRCKKCAIKRNSGEGHCNYNPNLTDEEREKGRYIPGYNKWVADVYKQSNNACQCCGETEEVLCAHHIESYGDNEELRTVVSNGIAFCEEHHIEFHKKYGYGNNTREQLNEFLSFFAEIIKIDDRNR